jgi:hypothetical protein
MLAVTLEAGEDLDRRLVAHLVVLRTIGAGLDGRLTERGESWSGRLVVVIIWKAKIVTIRRVQSRSHGADSVWCSSGVCVSTRIERAGIEPSSMHQLP